MLTTRIFQNLLVIICLFGALQSVGQVERAALTGKVVGVNSREPVFSATVCVKGSETSGVLTDAEGNFRLEIQPGKRILVIRMIGYAPFEKAIQVAPGEVQEIEIALTPSIQELKTFVTSAGKYEQDIERLTLSLDVLRPNLIENKNTTSIENALQQVPGVSIVDGEPQIRSGSGYSFGAGSRVQILVDDLPVLSGDAGRPSWGFIPVENIEQVEIVKGAASVLYGSAALSGVMNIRTAYPRDEPQTKINVFSGIYNNPKNKEAIYWGKNNPFYSGLNFFHSRKVKNLDVVIGGNVLNDAGYKGPTPVNVNDSTFNPLSEQRGEFEHRIRLNFGLRWRNQKIQGLTYGLNGNGMISRSASALLWLNADSGMYRAYPGSLSQTLQDVFYLDPFIKYTSKKGWNQVLRNRIFYLNNNNNNNQSNRSTVFYSEYQLQRIFTEGLFKQVSFTSGIVHAYTIGKSDLYTGNLGDSLAQEAKSANRNIAAYIQLERQFFERLTLNAGARYEHFTIQNPSLSSAPGGNITQEGKPVFRAGANLKLAKASFLRASFGQGFRFPTIAEKFIRTAVGPIRIYPNESLRSESSWNAEVGFKQGFQIGEFQGYLDAAYFTQQFKNNIEFNFGQYGSLSDPLFGLGFASLNIGRTKVSGFDCSLAGRGKIGRTGIAFLGGYTYSNPISLEPSKPYPVVDLTNKSVTYARSSSDSTGYLLKYRFQHLIKADLEFTRGNWMFGASVRYNSFMKNIDKIFEDLDDILGLLGQPKPGIKNYRKQNNSGIWVLDARIAYTLNATAKISFIVSNLLNEEYTLRPMVIEQPRTTAVQVSIAF